MDGFEKRKEQKRESIRRAALELFQEYGFRKVSVSEIARKAGVSQVTIYNHFGSKDRLVREVLKWFVSDLVEKYIEIMSSDRPFQEKLEEIVFDKSRLVSQFHGELLNDHLQSDPEIQVFLQEVQTEKMIPCVEAFFRQGIAEGYINSGFSFETIMIYFEIIRRGFYDNPQLVERTEKNPGTMIELIKLITYGLNG